MGPLAPGGRVGPHGNSASSAEQAFELLRQRRPDAVVLDVRLPGMDGLTAMQRLHEELGNAPIIVITAYGELDTAVAAVRNGALDYLTKPFDLAVVQRAIERALSRAAEPPRPRRPPTSRENGQIVGRSPAMQEVFKRTALVAMSDACVHLHGESGVGKADRPGDPSLWPSQRRPVRGGEHRRD